MSSHFTEPAILLNHWYSTCPACKTTLPWARTLKPSLVKAALVKKTQCVVAFYERLLLSDLTSHGSSPIAKPVPVKARARGTMVSTTRAPHLVPIRSTMANTTPIPPTTMANTILIPPMTTADIMRALRSQVQSLLPRILRTPSQIPISCFLEYKLFRPW